MARKVYLHYHLFKNAGTSVDEAFIRYFGHDKWQNREFPNNPKLNRQLVAKWIEEENDIIVFSSHTAHLPPPTIQGVEIFPVIFLRDPLARISSAYRFERNQVSDEFGAVLARNTDLLGYITVRLALPGDRQCRDFQTSRLSKMYPESQGSELERALKALDELPFVGLVERFEESIRRLNDLTGLRLDVLKANTSEKAKADFQFPEEIRLANESDEELLKKLKLKFE